MGKDNLEDHFKKSADDIKNIGSSLNLSNDDLLDLYGYFKQATIGDCNIVEPSFWDFKEKKKYESWNNHKGMTKENAMKRYIKKVEKLINK
jgi:diazepam-binding inhibitor (GABA receptor modulating acyl-CoA-binding protein)